MTRFRRWWPLLLVPLLSCGNPNRAVVYIRLADGIQPTLLREISSQMNTVYRGIYFEFRELKCPPTNSIYDYLNGESVVALTWPNIDQPGVDPLQPEFAIDTSSLKTNAFYQVRMLAALHSGAAPPYEGRTDCPLYIGMGGENRIVICFGLAGMAARNCMDTIPQYGMCPLPSPIKCN
jgi:hypothetical protein